MGKWDFDPARYEGKWQEWWEDNKIFYADDSTQKPKYYVLDMFPYPSGAGLHVGHPLGYIATDIIARFKKMQGFNVLHPMGFDAFGLPAEQYAIQTGRHPRETTYENIRRYKQQMKRIGLVYDWSREVITCDPAYYRWTQWIFVKMFNSWYNMKSDKAEPIDTLIDHLNNYGTYGLAAYTGEEIPRLSAQEWRSMDWEDKQWFLMNFRLAYLAEAMVNWCPALGTVLANEEVVWDPEKGLVSERGGYPVERRPLKQWFLRITAYAERLLRGLEHIDWPESIKEMQRNWIGRSEGAIIDFRVKNSNGDTVRVFTTRPDTIFGVTFICLAPEHPLVFKITSEERLPEVKRYVEWSVNQPERERISRTEPTGVFTGAYAVHPFTGKELPIWVSDYVLMHYGTGAVMGVPAHDQRDWRFAKKFGLPVIQVIDHPEADVGRGAFERKEGVLINSGFLNGLEVKSAIEKIVDELEARGLGKRKVMYRMKDFLFSRQRYWGEPIPIVYVPSKKGGEPVPVAVSEDELPVELPHMDDFSPRGDFEPPLARLKDWIELPDGKKREANTMPGWAGSNWYFLRYMDPHNDRLPVAPDKEAYWGPVDLYVGGAEHATAHLIYARFVNKFLKDIGIVSHEEPFYKLFNQGMIQGTSFFIWVDWEDKKAYSKNVVKSLPETIRSRLMKVRFPVKYIKDGQYVDIERIEELRSEYSQFKDIEFVAEDSGKFIPADTAVEKMSKSYLNVVNPDDVIDQYGADVFRVYEMFLGPLNEHKPWDLKGIAGAYRFIRNVWTWLVDPENGPRQVSDEDPPVHMLKVLHRTIKKVTEDIEALSMNTAVSALMSALNTFRSSKVIYREVAEVYLKLLAPFAPHIAEELWQLALGNNPSIFNSSWPSWDQKYLQEEEVECPVAVNGKKRLVVRMPVDWNEDKIREHVLNLPELQRYLSGRRVKRVVVVPKKIVNIVLE